MYVNNLSSCRIIHIETAIEYRFWRMKIGIPTSHPAAKDVQIISVTYVRIMDISSLLTRIAEGKQNHQRILPQNNLTPAVSNANLFWGNIEILMWWKSYVFDHFSLQRYLEFQLLWVYFRTHLYGWIFGDCKILQFDSRVLRALPSLQQYRYKSRRKWMMR